MTKRQAKFTTGNIFRHITVMTLTASIGLMAIFMVDLVDMIFISMLGKAELAAAVGYAGAVLFFTTSFGIGMSISAGALVARALGAGDGEMASRRSATTMTFGVLTGVVFAGVVWLNIGGLLRLLGASGGTLELGTHYLQIIVPSLPFLLVGMVGGAILRAHGAAKQAMMATIIGGVVNAILDPILIFGFDLELTGAAAASVVARVTIGAVTLYPIYRYHGGLRRPTFTEMRMDFTAIFAIAMPAILTQLATPVGQAYVTRSMAAFGEDAVAGMAIVGRLTPVAFGVLFALSGAVGPIIGQNAGARLPERVRQSFWGGLKFAAIVVVVMSALLFGLRGPIIALFRVDGITAEIVILFCGPLALAFYFNGVIFVSNAAYNNLGRTCYSTWVNWGRHTVGTIPFVILGGLWFGAKGVLIGQAFGGFVFAVLAVFLVRRVIADEGDHGHKTKPFQRQERLMSLFRFRR
uniref:MATE efflux family protein n=1 Tax=endosymbiont of Ridgeia piscesae TaxID=54398 RepID=D2CL09_9GAMM|nr:MATE efflux family protein [endosymbiont of Ridgeia piscesae]